MGVDFVISYFSRMTLNRSLVVGFGASSLFTLAIGVSSLVQGRRVEAIVQVIREENFPESFAIAKVDGIAKDLRGKMRSRVVATDATEARKLDGEVEEYKEKLNQGLAQLGTLMSAPEEQERLRELEGKKASLLTAWRDLQRDLGRQDGMAMANFKSGVLPQYEVVQASINRLQESIQADVNERSDEAKSAVDSSSKISIFLFLLSLAVNVLVAYWILRRTNGSIQPAVKQLEQSSRLIAAMSRELRTANEQISSGATEQVSSIQRTSEAGDHVKQASAEYAQAAGNIQRTVDGLTQMLAGTRRDIAGMVEKMNEITTTSNKIQGLSAIVESIAFQTHILSLNASIEAARSGEAGRGFEIVAGEVKSLAKQSSEAAQETASLIANSLEAVAAGSTNLDQIVRSIEGVANSTQSIQKLMDGIEASSQSQATDVAAISYALVEIETVASRTAAAAEEVFAQQAEMEIQANSLDGVVQNLNSLI